MEGIIPSRAYRGQARYVLAAMVEPAPPPVPRRRLLVYYLILAAAVGAIAVVVLAVLPKPKAQPGIAGGYDLVPAAGCLGAQADLSQSGQFVDLEAVQGDAGGNLRFRHGRLTGTVSCQDGHSAPLSARAAGGRLAGTIGGAPLAGVLKREPPTPGAPKPRAPGSVAADYAVSPRSDCLGNAITLHGGSAVTVTAAGAKLGTLTYRKGMLAGRVRCVHGGSAGVAGTALDRTLNLVVGGQTVAATRTREFAKTVAQFFLAIAVVMLVARAFGWLAVRLRQPRVMGEVAAGIALGPTLLGALFPGVEAAIFPSDVVPIIGVVANLGLIFYVFLVGLEIDPSQLRGRVTQAVAVSNTGVLVPMALGLLAALPIYGLVGPDKPFVAFALFMGVAMSITAFPVLARIIVERRMLKRPIGALALASAAIDDISAWFLIALATAVAAASGSFGDVARTIGLAAAFVLLMVFGARRVLARVATAYDEAGRVPGGWIMAIFAGVLVSAYLTEEIGIAVIFGAFVMGAIMPRHAGLTEDVTGRVEDFVVVLLLPLFFAYTGLRTNMLLLDSWPLVLLTLVLLVVAIAGKFGGTVLAARVTRLGWRESAVLGTLMNTRGLTELIVLNLALEKGVVSPALFAALVIMALVTTFMAGPVLRLIDPRNEFGAPVEEELAVAKRESEADSPLPVPDHSILVAPQTDVALDQLVALAEPLARSEPAREVIVARVLRPPRGAGVRGGLQTENRMLREAGNAAARARLGLIERGVAARAVALATERPGSDLVKLAATEEVDLVLVDGRRPLLGVGVPRGEVGDLLRDAPSDVAVLVAREQGVVLPGADAPVLVPFGGAEHDWAALELGAWLASATGAQLHLLGTAEGQRSLANASLLVQRFAGVTAEPVVVDAGEAGVEEAAAGAGLLVVGLSDRWRQEGLGPTRSEIARGAPAPILFVRRGTRPGALAPRTDVTRFTWSSPALSAR
jgi:Kef-type K+ transport system membrane component KefB